VEVAPAPARAHPSGVGRYFEVGGGQGGSIPGGLGPDGLDASLEWVPLPARPDLLEAVRARLGSEADPEKVVLGVLAPLRGWLEGEPLEALLRALPLDLAARVRDAERWLLRPVHLPAGEGDATPEIAALVQRSPAEARLLARAVLGAARETLSAAASAEIARRLPPDLAAWWGEPD
jgi:uncharacterized protein (DUF2267 family)